MCLNRLVLSSRSVKPVFLCPTPSGCFVRYEHGLDVVRLPASQPASQPAGSIAV